MRGTQEITLCISKTGKQNAQIFSLSRSINFIIYFARFRQKLQLDLTNYPAMHSGSPTMPPLPASNPSFPHKPPNLRNSFDSIHLDKQNLSNYPVKRKHKKYFSCECSPQSSPLKVQKQLLLDRNRQLLPQPFKEQKLKIKQKTQCFNTAYMKRLRISRETINWVRYNIEVGIYSIVGRIKKQLGGLLLKKKQFHRIEPQLVALHRCLQAIQKYSKSIPVLTLSNDVINNRFIVHKDKDKGDKSTKHTLEKSPPKDNTSSTIKPIKFEAKQFKEAVNNLSSALCLLTRKIALQKENKLIKQFFEQQPLINNPLGSKTRLSADKLAVLYQILQINNRRCSILHELADRLVEIDQFKTNFVLSDEQIKRLQNLHLARQLQTAADCKKDAEIAKIAQTVHSILNVPTPSTLSKNQPCIKSKMVIKKGLSNQGQRDQNKKGVRIATKASKSFRASIELMLDQINAVSNPPAQSTKFVPKSKTKVHYPTNHEMKIQPEKSQQPKMLFYQPKATKRKEAPKPKQKKALAFAHDICEGQINRIAKSNSKSAKSILMNKKGAKDKEAGSQHNIFSSGKFVSIKSLKSLRSMRSITSNGSYDSKLFARSLKTQHQIKFLKGRYKKVSGIRNYRSKIFKFNEDFSISSYQASDLLNFATQYLEEQDSSQEIATSLNNLIGQLNGEKVNPQLKSKEPNAKMAGVTNKSKNGKRTATNLDQGELLAAKKRGQNAAVFYRRPKKAVGMKEHPDDKSNAVRNFLTLCAEIKSGKHIVQKKKLFYQNFQRLYQSKLIQEPLYQQYKKYFHEKKQAKVQNKTIKLTTEQEQHQVSKKVDNPYQSLASLRKEISENRRLSQINKYYYHFDQFRGEQEQIEKTKQKTAKDQEFFNIKSYVGYREVYKDPLRRTMDHFNGRYLSRDDRLFQKEI